MNGFIYKISNSINDKIYIGKTLSTIEKRFAQHQRDALKPEENNRPLYRAMRKYGPENFSVELIEIVPLENLSEREKYWINYYHSYENGYNATLGGDGKQLYDYDAIVKHFLDGSLVKELADEFGCCTDTICQALRLGGLNPKMNSIKSYSKALGAFKNDILIKSFESRMEAVSWLQENGYTKSTNRDNINAAIGRAANGQRKTAYGLQWKNL